MKAHGAETNRDRVGKVRRKQALDLFKNAKQQKNSKDKEMQFTGFRYLTAEGS